MALGRVMNPAAGEEELDIHDLSSNGEGVGRLPDGRAVFVPGTAPGDRVRVEVTLEKPRFARGRLLRVLSPSGLRREARCPLFGACGGCQLQHIRYGAQLDWKSQRIAQALQRIGGISVEPPRVEPSPREWEYRNRMSFALRRLRGGRIVAGLHASGRPGRVLDVQDECLLPEPGLLRVWVALRAAWGPGARLLPPGGELRLTLRQAQGGVALVVEGGAPGGDARALVEGVPELVSVAHRPAGGALHHVAGVSSTLDRWFGEEIPVASSAFMQVNRELAESLHLSVLEELGSPTGARVVDAYCGVGAYGRRLARQGAWVVGIELDADAAEAAGRDAPPGLEIRGGRVEDILPSCLPADRVILNPPRAGLDEAVPGVLRERPVHRIVYVSCDPATLARDLARLGEGYRVRRVRGFDLFPQTTHVETVVTLDHASHDRII